MPVIRRLFVLFLFVVLSACEITPGREFTPGDTDNSGPEDIPIVNNLFVPSGVPGQTLFETNDPRYITGQGASLWFVLTDDQPGFTSREVGLSKISGRNAAGYGLVINYRKDPVYGDTMLIILINTLKEYLVAEITSNSFDTLIPWTGSPFLVEGYNRRNSLKLNYESGVYSLVINGQLEATFRDDTAPQHKGGRQGYIAVISPLDEFPGEGVKILFTEITEQEGTI